MFPSHVTWYDLSSLPLFTVLGSLIYCFSFSKLGSSPSLLLRSRKPSSIAPTTGHSLSHCHTQRAIEWSLFAILNSGLDVVESLGAGTEAVAGLFQSFAVRASGFSIVSIASLAPSFQWVIPAFVLRTDRNISLDRFMCIVMMYIAIYPVALSIRSTNV